MPNVFLLMNAEAVRVTRLNYEHGVDSCVPFAESVLR